MAAKFHLMSFYAIRKVSYSYGHILYEQNLFVLNNQSGLAATERIWDWRKSPDFLGIAISC